MDHPQPTTADDQQPTHSLPRAPSTGTLSTEPGGDPDGTARFHSARQTLPGPSEFVDPASRAPAGYEILLELGRGAMGVVYSARQVSLNRVVALKMVLSGEHAEPRELVRFLAEAEAAASIDHPNVVRVYEFGQHGGRPYLSMEYVSGGTLADRIRSANNHAAPFPPPEAAEWVERIARGVEAAHETGIVHRDLKPGNILIASDGTPKVADFGLAKRRTGSDLTNTGAILGTPAYMAPEQARGQTKYVGPPADVHALGAILFTCLTGRPPFDESDAMAVLVKVANQEAPDVRKYAPSIPKDLSVICAKCLNKDPKDRYPTAGQLAEDLRRYLDGKPILARRSGAVDQLWRWCRRNPVVATSLLAVAALLLVSSVGASVAAVRYEAKRTAAETAEKRANRAEADQRTQLHQTELNRAREKRAAAGLGQRFGTLQAVRDLVRDQPHANPDDLTELREEVVAALSTRDMRPVGPARPLPPSLQFGVDVTADLRLCVCEDPGTGRTVIRSLDDSRPPVHLPAHPAGHGTTLRRFSPDGKRVVMVHSQPVPGYDPKPDKIQVASASDGTIECEMEWVAVGVTPTFLPSGERLLVQDGLGVIHLFDLRSKSQVAQSAPHFRGQQFAIHPDGSRVAVAEAGTVLQILDLKRLQVVETVRIPLASSLAWSPNGVWLGVGLASGGVTVWNAIEKSIHACPPRHLGPVFGVRFLTDDRHLVTWSADGESQIWHWSADRLQLRFPGRVRTTEPRTDRFAVETDRALQLFDPVDDGEYRVLPTFALSASPSPDGRFLAVSEVQGITLWDTSSGNWIRSLGMDECGPVRFRPGEPEFVTFGQYSRVNRWPYRYDERGRLRIGPPTGVPFTHPRVSIPGVAEGFLRKAQQLAVEEPRHLGRSVAWTASGRKLLVCDFKDWRLVLTHPYDSAPIKDVVADFKDPIAVAASPDGEYFSAGRFRFPEVGVWRAKDGQRLLTIAGHRSAAFSPDGRWFASAGADSCCVYRTGEWGEPAYRLPIQVNIGEVDGPPLAFRGDGRLLALPVAADKVGILDITTGRIRLTVPLPFAGPVADIAFAPDGGELYVTLPYRNVHVWNLRRIGEALTELGLGLPAEVLPRTPRPAEPIAGVEIDRGSLPPAVTGWTATHLKMAHYEFVLGKYPDAVEAATRAVRVLEHHRPTGPYGEALFARSQYYLWNNEPVPARDDLTAALQHLPDRVDVRLALARLAVLGPMPVRDPGLALNVLSGWAGTADERGERTLLWAAALVQLHGGPEAGTALDAVPEGDRGVVWLWLKTRFEFRNGGKDAAAPWRDRANVAFERAAKRIDDRIKMDELRRLKAETEPLFR